MKTRAQQIGLVGAVLVNLAVSAPAYAIYPFRCGTYRLPARLTFFESAGKVIAKAVLFENSFSQTSIPLALSIEQAAHGSKLLNQLLLAQIDLEIDDGGYDPKLARLVSYRLLSDIESASDTSAIKQLKAKSCQKPQ